MGCIPPQIQHPVLLGQTAATAAAPQPFPQRAPQPFPQKVQIAPNERAPEWDDGSVAIWRADDASGHEGVAKYALRPPPSAATLSAPSASSKRTTASSALGQTTPRSTLPPGSCAKEDPKARYHQPVASESTRSPCTSASGRSTVRRTTTSSDSSKNVELDSFPSKMTSLNLVATNFRSSDFSFEMSDDGDRVPGWSVKVSTLGFAAHRLITSQIHEAEKDSIKGAVSEAHHITLSNEELSELGIVREARYFVFSYPIVTAQELKVSAKDSQVADVAFLVFGGYMYFDSDMVLRDVRAVVPDTEGGLRFGPPQPWMPEWTTAAGEDRWRPVTLPSLRKLGVRYFAWLRPGETLNGQTLCRNGGFAYIFHEPSEIGVLQAKLDVYFQLEEREVDHGKGCPQCSRLLEWSDYSEGVYVGGWTCEYIDTCAQDQTEEAPMRWFCAHCQLDICDTCYTDLKIGGARKLLHDAGADATSAAQGGC